MAGIEQGSGGDFAPLGLPTRVLADDPALAACAEALFGDWPAAAPPAAPAIVLRLEAGAPSTDVSFRVEVEGSRLRLVGRSVRGEADAAGGTGRAAIPANADDAIRRELIDTLFLFLATRRGRTPLHAAGIFVGGTALALAGPSGSGKSSLALAAAQRGLAVLSDDMLFVGPGPLIHGYPRPIHLLPDEAPVGAEGRRARNGSVKAAVPIAPGLAATGPFDDGVLVVLRRGSNVALAPIPAAEAASSLARLDPGFDLLAEQSAAAIAELARSGAWALTLGRDPAEAIDRLVDRFG